MRSRAPEKTYRVPALERALRILELFDIDRPEIAAPEMCRELRLPRTSVFRILLTLESFGYVERAGGNAYRIGPALHRPPKDQSAALGTPRGPRMADDRFLDTPFPS